VFTIDASAGVKVDNDDGSPSKIVLTISVPPVPVVRQVISPQSLHAPLVMLASGVIAPVEPTVTVLVTPPECFILTVKVPGEAVVE
jgi:hypothetical protein